MIKLLLTSFYHYKTLLCAYKSFTRHSFLILNISDWSAGSANCNLLYFKAIYNRLWFNTSKFVSCQKKDLVVSGSPFSCLQIHLILWNCCLSNSIQPNSKRVPSGLGHLIQSSYCSRCPVLGTHLLPLLANTYACILSLIEESRCTSAYCDYLKILEFERFNNKLQNAIHTQVTKLTFYPFNWPRKINYSYRKEKI